MNKKNRKTKRGTTCAQSWNDLWIKRVDQIETELDTAICGAATPKGEPCTSAPAHPNGRCRLHGGHPNIGPPAGNQNGRTHGLYTRRLQVCGDHCIRWDSCTHASDEILDMSPKYRPNCVFEQQEYDLLTGSGAAQPREQTSALLQVFVGRAAAALSVSPMVETVSAGSEKYSMKTTKMSSALQAFLRLARENHRYLMGMPQKATRALQKRQEEPKQNELHEQTQEEAGYHEQTQEEAGYHEQTQEEAGYHEQNQGIADLMQPLFEKTKGVIERALEEQALDEAGRPPGG